MKTSFIELSHEEQLEFLNKCFYTKDGWRLEYDEKIHTVYLHFGKKDIIFESYGLDQLSSFYENFIEDEKNAK